jgi:hypothetical protein
MVGSIAIALLTSFIALTAAGSAEAGAIKVGTGTPASCTDAALRDALAVAEAQGGGTISFKCGKDPVAITLLATLIPPDNTTINGGGLITLQATAPPRMVVGTVLTVPEDTTVVLKGLVIRSDNNGIVNDGTLTLRASTVTGAFLRNIVNSGTLTVVKSTISKAFFDVKGGGISNSGTLIVKDSTFLDNFGGAIASGGIAAIHNSTFVNNHFPEGRGGAINNNGIMLIRNSLIEGNDAFRGGGIWNEDTLKVVSTTITGNTAAQGGGIYNCRPTDPLFGDFCQGTPITFRHTSVTNNVPDDVFPDGD